MELPQEIEVWYIIPSIRKALAEHMMANGARQKDVAKRLGIAKSAVSQYLSRQRGCGIKLGSKAKSEISKAAARIMDGKSCATAEIQSLCRMLRKDGTVCKVHRLKDKMAKNCGVCK